MISIKFLSIFVLFTIGESFPTEEDKLRKFLIGFGSSQNHKDVPPNAKFENLNIQPNEFKFTNDGSGNYIFGFNIPGFSRYEVGELKNAGSENEIQTVRGQYTEEFEFDGRKRVVRRIGYTADENGYQPFVISVDLQDAKKENKSLMLPTEPPLPVYLPPIPPSTTTRRPVGPGAPRGTGISSSILGNIAGSTTIG